MNEQTKRAVGPARRPLRVDFRQQKTSGLSVEPRRALAVYRALNLSDDRTSSQMLLNYSGRRMRLESGVLRHRKKGPAGDGKSGYSSGRGATILFGETSKQCASCIFTRCNRCSLAR